MAGLSSLDFQPRLHFEALTHDRFGSLSSASSFDDAGDFFLLTLFGHSAFRLDEDVVSLILRLVLGDLAILHLVLEVHKDDFELMAAKLKDFFIHNYSVRHAEVQPCPIGDASVRFNNPVERERFLDKIMHFGPDYQMFFVKHDEGKNARFQNMDKEVWVMLMIFPPDAKNNTAIAKAVVGFGLLHYWHDTNNIAIVVAKVNLNDGAKIPHGVLVSARVPSLVRSWMCPVFVLKQKGVTMLPDEDPIPPNGSLFPLPPLAQRWRGLHGPAAGNDHGSGSQSLVASLMFLASISVDQEDQPVVFGPVHPLVPYSDDEYEPDEVMEVDAPKTSATLRKRRARKMKESLEDIFLRRSKRLNPDVQGFRNTESEAIAQEYLAVYSGSATGPSMAPTPHPLIDVVQGIISDFL
uniref:DUF4283 domain-containing protein n=1 Tax=Setaria viridis TaxID=4556 RepID=A0A4U6TDY0_SETVI|nr:hypothetical protein SEVIR_8G103100v2 [Setaria viridis]